MLCRTDIGRLRCAAGLTEAQAIRRLGVDLRTWQRWRAQNRAPVMAVRYLQLLARGELWPGWVIDRAGALWSPEGVSWTREQLIAWHWDRQALAAYRASACCADASRAVRASPRGGI